MSQIWTIRQFSRGVMGSVKRQICPIRGPCCNDSVHFPRRSKVGMYSLWNRCQNLSTKSRVVLLDKRRRSRWSVEGGRMFADEAKGKYGKMKCEGVNTNSSSASADAAIRGQRFMTPVIPTNVVSNMSGCKGSFPVVAFTIRLTIPTKRSHTPP